MRIIFRALLLLFLFFIILGIVKFVFIKLFFTALWLGSILLVIYFLYAILKRA